MQLTVLDITVGYCTILARSDLYSAKKNLDGQLTLFSCYDIERN